MDHELVKDIAINIALVVLTWFAKGKKKSIEERLIMNWLTALTNVFKLVPYVVAGVETIHQNESTETKTQLAQDALSIATAGAMQILGPANAQIAGAVSSAVSAGITSVQSVIAAVNTPVAVPAPAGASVPVTPLTSLLR
jgi:hypothetical protein